MGLYMVAIMLRRLLSSLTSRMSSNQGCCKAYSPVSLSAGFIYKRPII